MRLVARRAMRLTYLVRDRDALDGEYEPAAKPLVLDEFDDLRRSPPREIVIRAVIDLDRDIRPDEGEVMV